MDYDKELKKIINKQQKNFPQIKKKQQEIFIDGKLYQNLNKVEYVIHKGENICQIETKS